MHSFLRHGVYSHTGGLWQQVGTDMLPKQSESYSWQISLQMLLTCFHCEGLPFSSFCTSSKTCSISFYCDTIHNRMMSQESNKYPYCTLVSHGCIHVPLVRPQAKPKVVRSYTGSTEMSRSTASHWIQPSICKLHYSHRRKTLAVPLVT